MILRILQFLIAITIAMIPFCGYSMSAPPENDFCVNAITLTLANSSDFPDENRITANTDGGGGSPNLDDCSIIRADIWYKITVPDSGSFGFSTKSIDDPQAVTELAIYSGGCDNLSLVSCGEYITANSYSYKKISGQHPGETLYIRVTKKNLIEFNEEPFYVFAFKITPPENDVCVNATSLELGDFPFTEGELTTSKDATTSGVEAPECGDYKGNDVWFSAVVPASGNIGFATKAHVFSYVISLELTAYEGSCDNLTQIKCGYEDGRVSSFGSVRLSNRTPGETIYVRAWIPGNSGIGGVYGDEFLISAYHLNPSVNNYCSSPINLQVGKTFDDNSITTMVADNIDSQSLAPSFCKEERSGMDHWYTVTIPDTGSVIVKWSGAVNNNHDTTMFVYSGDGCGNLISEYCEAYIPGSSIDNERSISIKNKTPGEQFFVRLIHYDIYSISSVTVSAYDITPDNDFCVDAVVLNVGGEFDDDFIIGSLNIFTNDTDGDRQNCTNSSQSDYEVWYKVVVPDSGDMTFEIRGRFSDAEFMNKKGILVYSGDCENLSRVACLYASATNNFENKLEVTGMIPGETLYVSVYRFYEYDPEESFRLSVYDSNILGIEDLQQDNVKISLFSNPFNDEISLKSDTTFKEISIYNVLGEMVETNSYEGKEYTLDISSFSSGLYIIQVNFENITTSKVFKFLKV